MTQQTAILKVNYPDEYDDPYWTDIKSTIDGFETFIQPNQENFGMYIHSDAIITLDGDTLTWDDPIYLRFTRVGKTLTILANNVTVTDGQILYVVAPARPLADANVSMQAASAPGQDTVNVIPIGIRVGTRIYLFNFEPKPWDKTFTSGSIGAGLDWDEHVEMKLHMDACNFQLVLLQKVSGAPTDIDLRIYDGDPSGAGVIKYQVTGLDLDTAKHEDPNVWFFEMPTSGDFYFKVTNNTGGAVECSLRLRMKKA